MMKNRFKSFVAVAIGLMLGAVSMASIADPVFTRFESKTMVAAQDEHDDLIGFGESVAVLPKSSETARLCSATASEKADSTFTFESDPTIAGHTLAAPAPFDPGKGYAQT